MTFLFFICETYIQPRHKRAKLKTVNQYWRDFKRLYRRSNQGRVVNANDCEEIRKHIHGRLKSQFNLDDQPGFKPVMGVDDLLLGLTQHWCRDRSVFPTEDDRLDPATIMLFQSYTAYLDHDDAATGTAAKRSPPMSHGITQSVEEHNAVSCAGGKQEESEQELDSDSDDSVFDTDDPYDSDDTKDTESDNNESDGTTHQGGRKWQFKQAGEPMDLDEAEEDHEIVRKHKALCYEDIVLWLVQDPNGGDRDVLAMEVMFRHHKGAKNKPKPTIFLFRENPLPILCPITHILTRAIRDDAIEVEGFNKASRLFSSHIRRSATRVYWKSSILKTPVFRRSIRTAGGWVKSKTEPMKYSTYAFYLDRIGTELGSEEKWTSYCFRRGHANALLGIAPDSIVDQVMRHDPLTGCLQNAYQNSRVGFNTQDAFLERDPSADGLTRAFTHMSIKCNPEVPKQIPKAELAKLPPDPEVVRLAKQVEAMARRMRQDYGFIKAAPERLSRHQACSSQCQG
ncbi:FluG domain-containing protein, partial [Metarhizium majus ARSEF 297]